MTYALDEEQRQVKESAARFLKKEYSCDQLHIVEEKNKAYAEDIWNHLVELGWSGLLIHEDYGGWGGTPGAFQTLLVLLEEMGRHLFVGPYFSTMLFGALAIARHGTEDQKRAILPRIASGELKVTLAAEEMLGPRDLTEIETMAMAYADGYELSGTKALVEGANDLDFCLCAARTVEGRSGWDGLTLFVVDLKSEGITIKDLPTVGLERQCEVSFNEVKVDYASVLGDAHRGGAVLDDLLAFAAVEKCAEMVGALEASLDMTVRYAMERVQYGRPIGSNQVIQHYLANVWMDLARSREILAKAASVIDQKRLASEFASVAKAWVGKALLRSTERCLQIHGAIGTTKEHNISFYYKQAMAWDRSAGSSNWHVRRVAQSLRDGRMIGLT